MKKRILNFIITRFYILISGKKTYESKDLNKCIKKASKKRKDYDKRYSIYKNQKNYKIIKEMLIRLLKKVF